jgi:hypothetical protein
VEKKRARKERQVRCKVDVEVDGASSKIDLEVEAINETWVAKDPGRTVSKACKSPKPAWRTVGGVFEDLS